ncbi:MAG TPA: HlyD family efflux transporter periplasmic adaptor subunit [Candidatus Eisenbacteria bacterium]|nr:HlyD family efflux transporter periplasmic adaptor subunit [Candidatus Eisenbacteria bacterium]
MKSRILTISGIVVLGALTATVIWGRTTAAKQSQASKSVAPVEFLIAAAGRVEPGSEDIKLASELNGKLKTILVEEGDYVRRGQVLAELENSDYRAQVESAAAEVLQKEAELRKVINGARMQERREALSSVEEARAVMNNAQAEMERRKKLFAAGVISREEADRYVKEYEVAKARYEEMSHHHDLVAADAREEDRAMAEAGLQLARARLEESRAVFEKTFIRAPIDGTVLRKFHRAGESVSNSASNPDPIFTVGDKRALRVRVDVDEADVSKLTLGQAAYVTADAYGSQRFTGHVVRIGEELGRKNVRTDEPTERVDNKILETLVELDKGIELPVGLRVNAFIVGDKSQQAALATPGKMQ